MSGRISDPEGESPTDDEPCEDCLGGLLDLEEECPTCEPRRKLRKADPGIARRLASKEWRSMFDRAREHLGVNDQDDSRGVYYYALQLVFTDRIFLDAGIGAVLEFEHEESILSDARELLVETGRVSHALAAWLGTSSVIPIQCH